MRAAGNFQDTRIMNAVTNFYGSGDHLCEARMWNGVVVLDASLASVTDLPSSCPRMRSCNAIQFIKRQYYNFGGFQ